MKAVEAEELLDGVPGSRRYGPKAKQASLAVQPAGITVPLLVMGITSQLSTRPMSSGNSTERTAFRRMRWEGRIHSRQECVWRGSADGGGQFRSSREGRFLARLSPAIRLLGCHLICAALRLGITISEVDRND